MSTRSTRFVGVAVLAALIMVVAAACDSASAPLPVTYNVTASLPYVLQPNKAPAGSNDKSCKSTTHPIPVILVPATIATMGENYSVLSPLLKNNGYCVFSFNYGQTALTTLTLGNIVSIGPVTTSAGQLATFVQQVRSWTGASKVDLVGHSQGGMMPNYYINFLGGAQYVHTLVALAPSNHGTTLDGLVNFGNQLGMIWPGLMPFINTAFATGGMQALADQEVGSPFMQKMATKPDTSPGVNYTVIETKYDEVVTPYTNAFLSGTNVNNITLQNQCSLDKSDHLSIAFDHIALQDVLNALDPAHPATAKCSTVLPGIGG